MTGRTVREIVILVLAPGMLGCGGYGSSWAPTAPSPIAPAPAVAQSPLPPLPPQPSPRYGASYLWYEVSVSGRVTELTPAGQVPVEHVSIYCDACGEQGHSTSYTDSAGRYSFPAESGLRAGIWLSPGVPTTLLVRKEGYDLIGADVDYGNGYIGRNVTISGDTRFDIQLVRH
jgi:hypothetical protein